VSFIFRDDYWEEKLRKYVIDPVTYQIWLYERLFAEFLWAYNESLRLRLEARDYTMNITAIGSTLKEVIFTRFRILRTDDEGRLEVVAPSGAPTQVDIQKVVGVTPATNDAADAGERPLKTGGVVELVEPAAMAVGDKAHTVMDQFGNTKIVGRSHDYGIQADRTAEVAPLSGKYEPFVFPRPNITHAAWVYDYFSMDNALGFVLQIIAAITGGDALQLTVAITVQDDGTVPGSCTYDDITAMLASGSPVITASRTVQASLIGAKYVRIGYYITGGDTSDVTVYGKRWY
jgi:hypothetical protein